MVVSYEELKETFREILESRNFKKETAIKAAEIFAQNHLDGVYSHGANRFPLFVSVVDKKEVDPNVLPTLQMSFGALERWDGHRGFGPINAQFAMDRAIELAKQYGIGCVALGNSNHWMRGGSYGWQAAAKGMIGICWSLTTANMPAWGGKDVKIGNNPLIMAIPKSDGNHIVIDVALSQYSYGKLWDYKLRGKDLPYPGGYDKDGNLTTDPNAIDETLRFLPIGYWKGSGLSICLDAIATVLTNANSVQKVHTFENEVGLSQVFITIDPTKFNSIELTDSIVDKIQKDIQSSIPAEGFKDIHYPGQGSLLTREENLKNGLPVLDEIWDKIQALKK